MKTQFKIANCSSHVLSSEGKMEKVSAILLLWIVVINNIVALDGELPSIRVSIIPEADSTEPCNFTSSCFSNVSYCNECSSVTLNELIDASGPRGGVLSMTSAYFYELVFLPGMHIVNSSMNRLIFPTKNLCMNLTGEGVVTIFCVTEFQLRFLNVQYLGISNIKFKYCNGRTSMTHDQVQTITLYTNPIYSVIVFDRIMMINRNRTGIRILFRGKLREVPNNTYVVSLTNSNIVAGNVEIMKRNPSYKNGNTCRIQIDNVSFLQSCFQMNKNVQVKDCEITVANTSFTNGSCSPILLFPGLAVIQLINLTVRSTTSAMLLHSVEKNSIFLQGHCHFYDNRGAILIASKSELVFQWANVEFIENYVDREKLENPGAVIAAEDSRILFNDSHVTFERNHGQICGGIAATNEAIIAFSNSRVEFINNNGSWGGAMSLYSRSKLISEGNAFNSTVTFIRNKAQRGGAIYVNDRSYIHDHKIHTSAIQTGYKVQFDFIENEAYKGGSNIYGGWIEWSINMAGNNVTYDYKFGSVLFFEGNNSLGVTSDPTRLCLCADSIPNCNLTERNIKVYPGEKFGISLVGIGQRYGMVETHVRAKLIDQFNVSSSYIGSDRDLQDIKEIKNECTMVEYTVLSLNKQETFQVTSWSDGGSIFQPTVLERYPDKLGLLFKQLSVQVLLKECPLGFLLDKVERRCVCYTSLGVLGLSCDSLSYRIHKSKKQWIGVVSEHLAAGEDPGVIAHQYCPFDYCRTDEESLLVSLEHQDEQCAFNRSGVLCGGCKTNFSRVLGSSKCKKCSNLTLLILPAILLAGLLLVILLTILDLTVSVGTINGLIFYANIIQIQHSTFFGPVKPNSSFLSTFIAWLNLDLGIEFCLYNGLDAHTEMWLQFCFPLYMWVLAAIVIILSHYFDRISKLGGRNAVNVLATLLLLSYTKFLRLFTDVLSSTTITYPDGYTKSVWLHDGNIYYLKGKHVPLFIASVIILLLFILPYTLVQLGIQWLYKIPVPHYRIGRLIHRFKVLSDAYHGLYKPNHRYWGGLLLLARIVLLITFTADRTDGTNIGLLVTVILSLVLQVWMFFTKWVYQCTLINCLEVLYLCNLGITSTVLLLELSTYNTQVSCVCIEWDRIP